MDFWILPPEINSGRMYAGAGSGPMLDAAAAWDSLAAELHSAAKSYSAVLSTLTSGWRGPSAIRMESATIPYIEWLHNTAARAGEVAARVRSVVDAYQTALAATVPPLVVETNRTELASLITTNIVGQNTQAIMTVEARYADMWIQDVEAMDGYARSSAAAIRIPPFTSPPETTDAAGTVSQQVATASALASESQPGLSQLTSLISAAPSVLGNTGASVPTTIPPSLDPILALLAPSSPLSLSAEVFGALMRGVSTASVGLVNIIFSMNLDMLWMQAMMSPVGMAATFGPQLATATAVLNTQLTAATPTVTANFGGAGLAGALSVPPAWASATPTARLVASALQCAGVSAAPAAAAAGLLGKMAISGLVGGAAGRAAGPAINVASVRRADMVRGKDSSESSKFERVVAELSEHPDSVQHWHTDKTQLESLLDNLSKKPGTHAVHIHPGGRGESGAPTGDRGDR